MQPSLALSSLEWGLMDLLAAKGCSKSLDTTAAICSAQCELLAVVHGGSWIAGHQFDPVRSDMAETGWAKWNLTRGFLVLPIHSPFGTTQIFQAN